ncbi:MAG TPA: excinuclease ABC subunit UvrA [Verrucomicrobiae bacterium]|nr:excinuclease ABC subunit UvrA [Verrucomicrobiae bacterium]
MDAIVLRGVKTHNLKDLDLILPHKRFYVITGVSGSGKSSLAFDTLYAEGQRRYVESLSAYARQFLERMEKPDVEGVSGIPPALAIEAKNTINNARSTVGTQTEINDYLRVFFARIGQTFCPDCGIEVTQNNPLSIAGMMVREFSGKKAAVLFRVPLGQKGKNYLKESLAELERQGFTEFFYKGAAVPAAEIEKQKLEELQVVADQMAVEEKSKKRLVDSVELAFRLGKGAVQIAVGSKVLKFSDQMQCRECERVFREPVPNLFSFNSPLGACPLCQGFGRVITIDWNLVVPDEKKSLRQGAIEPWTKPSAEWEKKQMIKYCEKKGIPLDKPWKDLSQKHRDLILFGPGSEKEYFSVKNFYEFLETKTYKMHVRIFLSKYRCYIPCSQCHGTRLKPEAIYVKVGGKSVADLQHMNIEDLLAFVKGLKFSKEDFDRVEPVFLEITGRLRFLVEVGLGYLSLGRLSRTLSGGEVQRINLASSLGSALVDTLYVLDEPSIGLHERDNYLLIRLLRELRDLGNTVVVVEHDRAMIEAADEVLDMGPRGGENGGRLLFQGPVKDLHKIEESFTGQYLSGKLEIKRRGTDKLALTPEASIEIKGATGHNLKGVDVKIPLGKMVVVTGVSGSGKSTLIYDTLYNHYLRDRGQPVQDLGPVKAVRGLDRFDEMILVDQSPIGRTPRSNPITYIKAFDEIRKLLASTPQAKRQGFGPGHFSFNVDGGRCPHCKGDGRIKVEMHFLADVFIPCEACQAKRYKPEVLEIRYRERNVDEILGLTIDDAVAFFAGEDTLCAKLKLLQRVGLGYLRLGQSATTLSGGEAQRLKLAVEMLEKKAKHVVYLFDEPTTGLHYHDIHYLMSAFDELLAAGNSLIIIEHNMEIIRLADHVIDLGPEGGGKGGELIFQGRVENLLKCSNSHTGSYLKQYLEKLPKRAKSAV